MTARAVVGIGDLLWDLFPDGERLGGAPANVAVHAAALGVPARMVSAVGQDARGREAKAQLAARGVDVRAVAEVAELPTGTVRVTLDASGQPTFEIVRDVAWDAVRFDAAAQAAVGDAGAVVFGTMGQRSPAGKAAIRAAVAATPPDCVRMLDVNLRPLHHDDRLIAESVPLANAIKVNEDELPIVARACGTGGDTPLAQLTALAVRFGLRLAILTRGAQGAVLVADGTRVVEAPAPRVPVVDTVGAGDAFTATVLSGVLVGAPLAQVVARANEVAAWVCTQPGATPALPVAWRWGA